MASENSKLISSMAIIGVVFAMASSPNAALGSKIDEGFTAMKPTYRECLDREYLRAARHGMTDNWLVRMSVSAFTRLECLTMM